MPLRFSGVQRRTPHFTILEALDGEKPVRVMTCDEALKNNELPVLHAKASEKYDAKQFDQAGRISVYNSDFA